MAFFVQVIKKYNNDKVYMPLGTENQTIINDLKTLKGVLNRIFKKWYKIPDNFIIYHFNYYDIFKDFKKNQIVYKHFKNDNVKELYNNMEDILHDN